jgi:hypothetical protein
VKITGVSMLTFALYFNIGMDVEIGEFGTFSLKSVTFGDIAFAQESVEPIESDDQKIVNLLEIWMIHAPTEFIQ